MTEAVKGSLKDKLLALAKEEGLQLAEDQVKALIPFVIKLVKVVVEHTDTKIDDVIFAALEPELREALLEYADAIKK